MAAECNFSGTCGRGNRQQRIAGLNDSLRKTGQGGRVVLTVGITGLPAEIRAAIIAAVASFDHFDQDNDPHGEHDCAVIEVGGKTVIWKIDYYDKSMQFGSDDPADPAVTTRVLTIMLSEEY
ncbi:MULTISPECIES: DUF3768 domain-containing protein [unclassified Mesorhizobium]|uniref:DUF3768 domain-containing protein n=1 Tax=unclassified Mesorhizobium TaxID=325217 RepID=UPI001128D9A5|nr:MULTISPECIES: DUF3768 domain-containing protein [unclassified Mesorhizobium]TPL72305.1 DUF3768 domain-containing protein [Mesorhizobium sp. B2-3-15]TPM02108.1 DUF3768 domain-containing protein [Mesorhizobium sp. B2-3-10]